MTILNAFVFIFFKYTFNPAFETVHTHIILKKESALPYLILTRYRVENVKNNTK